MTVEPISGNDEKTVRENLVNLICPNIVFIIAVCSVTWIAIILFHFHNFQSKLVESNSLERPHDLSMVITEFWTSSPSEGGKTATASEGSVAHNHTGANGAIPRPVTLNMLTGNSLFEEIAGSKIFHYAIADVIRPVRTNYHNNRPYENTRKAGDASGISDVSTPINGVIAIIKENFKETFALLLGIIIISGLIIVLVIQTSRRREREARYVSVNLQEKIKQKKHIEEQMQEYTDRL